MRYTTNHIQQLKEGAISRLADTAYALRFLKLLVTPWNKTVAFKLGIVDKDGRRTIDPETKKKTKIETGDQKAAYTIFHRLVFNIKRLLNKIPFGKTRTASYVAALFLLREHTGMSEKKICQIIAPANSRIKVEEQIEPYSEFLGHSIYKVLHQKTNQEIYITNGDIVR